MKLETLEQLESVLMLVKKYKLIHFEIDNIKFTTTPQTFQEPLSVSNNTNNDKVPSLDEELLFHSAY